MRRLFSAVVVGWAALGVCGVANAADLGLPSPQPVPIPAYIPFSWTGIYAGGNIGAAWIQGDFTDNLGNTFTGGSNAGSVVFTGGGQIGANYQVNYWLVAGVEATFDWLTNNNSQSDAIFIPGVGTAVGTSVKVSDTNSWLTTVAARVGVAVERGLFYVKGGGGWVGGNEFTVTNINTGASVSGSNNSSAGGWLAGAGFEYAFANNWTAKVEYNFLGLSNTSITVPASVAFHASDTISTNNHDIQMVTVGFNYLFNWH